MIPLWYANFGEDFKITKHPKRMLVVTAERAEFEIEDIAARPLPVIGKGSDVIYVAFAGKRLAINKEQAMQISGDITGKTENPPEIMSAPAVCVHDCSKCRGCCG